MRPVPHIEKFSTPPAGSRIQKGFPKVDFCDSFSLRIVADISNDEIVNHFFFKFPGWIEALFKLRDILVKPFGLQTGGDKG